jgi:hypothetical protein
LSDNYFLKEDSELAIDSFFKRNELNNWDFTKFVGSDADSLDNKELGGRNEIFIGYLKEIQSVSCKDKT